METSSKPLVSIVIPIYGVENFIAECLDSVFSQTYKNLEFIFVNDKTPDNSMQILKQKVDDYKVQNINIINHEKNLGLCGARRTGLKAATSEYVMIVDSDDILPLDSVETLVNCALENDADFVESDFAYYSGGTLERYKRFYSEDKETYIAAFLSWKTAVSLWGKLYKRELFGDIDDLFVLGRDNVEDNYSTPILADRAKKIAYTNVVTYYYRIDNPTAYSKDAYVKWHKIDDMIYCAKRHAEYFSKWNSVVIQNALKEQKYKIKLAYYFRLENASDRKALMSLFPENESYVKSKSIKTRLFWFYMKHDMRKLYYLTSMTIGLVKKLYGRF